MINVPLKLPMYLVLEIMAYVVLLEYVAIVPRYFKHSFSIMYSHGFAAFLLVIIAILNEYCNNLGIWTNMKANIGNLYFCIFVIVLLALMVLQFGKKRV